RRRPWVSRVVALIQPREIYTDPFWAATDQRGQRIAHRVPAVVVTRREFRQHVVCARIDLVAPQPRLLDQPTASRVDDDPLVAPGGLDAAPAAPRRVRGRLDAKAPPLDLVDRLWPGAVGADHVLPRTGHAVEAARDLVHTPADAPLVVVDPGPG